MSVKKRLVIDNWLWPIAVYLLTSSLMVAAFPPWGAAEAIYLFAAPLSLWAFCKPSWKVYLATAFLAGWTGWTLILIWLRHVTLVGTIILAGIMSLFFVAWAIGVWWAWPKISERAFPQRLAVLAGLSGYWVVLEWVRSWIFSGFPWLPLAASQWQRPALLQMISYTGAYGLSFILIFFNLGIGVYLWHIITRRFSGREWWQRFCPEFYTALFLLLVNFGIVLIPGYFMQDRQEIFSAGMVQPYIQQPDKWDQEKVSEIIGIIEKYSVFADALDADVIFWPEAVTPFPVIGHDGMREFTEGLSRQFQKPILMGNLAREGDEWQNGIFVVNPRMGLIHPYYAKRKLVPFGEYIPFAEIIPFVRKYVPIDGSFIPGQEPLILPLKVGEANYRVGPLVCYEDIFPGLARSLVKSGADFLFVATNNAWYGEEAGAYQHAAHSVLRAVETRRPVLRCGNGGWSGWIDEYGNIRKILLDPKKGIYFRGTEIMKVSRDRRWVMKESFYVRFGDWFVALSGILAIAGYLTVRFGENEPDLSESFIERKRLRKSRVRA